jgi:hypothetical protein
VWGVLGADPRTESARSAAQRLDKAGYSSHLVWNPLHGEIVQLIPVVRAACSLGPPAHAAGRYGQPRPAPIGEINREGRICVQIQVVASADYPFTDGPLARLPEIMNWLDSWGVARNWPAGRPASIPQGHLTERSRRLWARGGHFGDSQVPEVTAAGPGAIDIERLTGWSARAIPPPAGGAALTGIGPGRAGTVPRPAALTHRPSGYDAEGLGNLLGEQVARAASLTRVR